MPDPTSSHARRLRLSRGWWLLSFAFAFGVASVLFAFGAPWVRRQMARQRAVSVASDLRQFATAFQVQATSQGDWPDGDASPAAFPAGMDARLAGTRWTQRTAIGGAYAWDTSSTHQGARYRAVLTIVPTTSSPVTTDAQVLSEIDRRLDDGNLATGKFLLGYRNQPIYVLEH